MKLIFVKIFNLILITRFDENLMKIEALIII